MEAVSELWTERAAAVKLIEQTEQAYSELDQQQWRGTPLPSNQPTMESFWQSPTPTPLTPSTTANLQTSRNKNKKYYRLRLGRRTATSTYKTPKVQCSIEGYIQRTSTTERAPEHPEEGVAQRKEGKQQKGKRRVRVEVEI